MSNNFLNFKAGKEYLAKEKVTGEVLQVLCSLSNGDLYVQPYSEGIPLTDFCELTDCDFVEIPDDEELFKLLKDREEGKHER